MRYLAGLFLVSIFCTTSVLAQLGIRADISPRAELRHGYRTMPHEDAKPAGGFNQRTRIILDWKSDNIITKISFQDVRMWGQVPQKVPVPSLEIHEAWAELLFTDELSVKAGRQELRYDNQRFFAINDWIPMAQKHDVALLKYETAGSKLHFATAFNQDWSAYGRNFGTPYMVPNYKYMNFLWFNTGVAADGNLSLLAVADGFEHDRPGTNPLYVRGTWSAYYTHKAGDIDLMVNPAFQHGKNPVGMDVSAFYFGAEAATNLTEPLRTTLGLEILSGNDPEDTDTYRAFDPTHGAGHANHGFMDYFTNIPLHTRGAGLVNPYLKNRYRLNARTNLHGDLHLFFIQNDFIHAGEEISKYLGTEVDLMINYGFNDFTRIIGGFSMMFGSESMEIIKSGSKDEPAYFVYLMLRIRPKLL